MSVCYIVLQYVYIGVAGDKYYFHFPVCEVRYLFAEVMCP